MVRPQKTISRCVIIHSRDMTYNYILLAGLLIPIRNCRIIADLLHYTHNTMRIAGLCLLLTIISTSFSRVEPYKDYCNPRFDFCIRYPATFKNTQQSENNDGATFTSKDQRAQILTYGRLAVEDLDKLEQEFGFATDKIKIHYKVIKSSWFIFSGVDAAGNIIYQKTVKKAVNYMGDAGTEVFQTIRISYPPSQQNEYKDYCGVIAKSF